MENDVAEGWAMVRGAQKVTFGPTRRQVTFGTPRTGWRGFCGLCSGSWTTLRELTGPRRPVATWSAYRLAID